MIEFENQDEVEAWLNTRSRDEIAIFAARAALRALPALGVSDFDGMGATVALPVFRALAATWVAARYAIEARPAARAAIGSTASAARAANDAAARAAAAAAAAANGDDVAYIAYAYAADAVAYAARSANRAAVYAAAVGSTVYAADAADAAVTAAAAAAAASAAVTVAAPYAARASARARVSARASARASASASARALASASASASAAADITALADDGVSAAKLARQPLWPNGEPSWFANSWMMLKAALHAADEGWEVWTSWYEARLAGVERINEQLELARVTEITEEEWAAGPAVVNARLREIAARFEASPDESEDDADADEHPIVLPLQTARAPGFASGEGGRIDVAPAGPTPSDANLLREEVVRKAQSLIRVCPEHCQDDRADIRTACEKLVTLLETPLDDEPRSAAAIWSYTGTLRAKLRADRRRREFTADEREAGMEGDPLAIGVSEGLEDLVDTLKKFADADVELHDVDKQEPTAEEVARAGEAMARGARSLAKLAVSADELRTSRAADVLRPVADGGLFDGGGDPKADFVSVGIVQNFVMATVEQAVPEATAQLEEQGGGQSEELRVLKGIEDSNKQVVEALQNALSPSSIMMTGAIGGAASVVGATAIANSGAALQWVVANSDLIISVMSGAPNSQVVVQIVQMLARLLS